MILVVGLVWAIQTFSHRVTTGQPAASGSAAAGGQGDSAAPIGSPGPSVAAAPAVGRIVPVPDRIRPATPRPSATTGVPDPPGTAGIVVRTTTAEHWQGGYNAVYSLTNRATQPVDHWTVVLTFSVAITGHAWNAQPGSVQGTSVTLRGMPYNSQIQPGQTQSFGMQVLGPGGVTPVLVGCAVNGRPCTG